MIEVRYILKVRYICRDKLTLIFHVALAFVVSLRQTLYLAPFLANAERAILICEARRKGNKQLS